MVALPKNSLYFRTLQGSLLVGAAYDALLGLAMLFTPQLLTGILGVPRPGEDFYLWLLGWLLLMLAGFYTLGAYDPMAYRGNIGVAIVGRAVAAAILAYAAWRHGFPGLYLPAVVDLLFAIVHTVAWRGMRRLPGS